MPCAWSQWTAIIEASMPGALAGLANCTDSSVRQAAKHHAIAHMTISRRLAGGKSHAEAREEQQLLTRAEEKALAHWVLAMAMAGNPVRHAFVREMAMEIGKRRVHGINDSTIELVSYSPLGGKWVQRFMQRHPYLQTTLSCMIESARLKDISEAVMQWFNTCTQLIEENDIQPGDIYNVDETGNLMGIIERSYVIVDSTKRTRYQAQPGRQEWVTAVECICADGSSILPLIIFKGEHLISDWIPPKDAPQ